MTNNAHVEIPLKLDDLYAAFTAADNVIMKKYIAKLSDAPCIEMADDLKSINVGDNVSLYRIAKVIYDKHENVQDKLTTIYSTVFSLRNCGLVMLINGYKEYVDLFVGVVSRNTQVHYKTKKLTIGDKELSNNGRVLRNAFLGNFPGTELKPVNNIALLENPGSTADKLGKVDIIQKALDGATYISAISSIPAIRNTHELKNNEFVQGLEKFVDTMRGKEYSAIVIADAMSNEKIEKMCAEYEDIYAQLAPFKTSVQTVNTQNSTTDTKGLVKGFTDTTNETIAKSLTHGTSVSKGHTDTLGGGMSIGIGINDVVNISANANYSHAYSRTKATNDATTNTTSSGTAKSLTEQNSVSKSLSSSNGESVQLTYENRAVKTLLDRIDEQVKRMRSCEDFGMFDCCTYFVAKEYDVAIAAASTFKSLTRGENSSIESSAVNVWENKEDVKNIKEYLMRFYHPVFLTAIDKDHQYPTSASMLLSGREMAYQMPLPKRSIAGVPVVDCAEFGREIVTLEERKDDISLGSIYHMHNKEPGRVSLDAKSLTAHTFITGSTGAGKSTTVYKLLDELSAMPVPNTKKNVKFMVIEPAKGEYKNVLAKKKNYHVQVYGTNPRISKLLRIDPFKFPSDKIHIYEHMDKLTEIFNVCWPMYAAMPAVLKVAIENAYRSAGWDLTKSENPYGEIYPSFVDVAIEVEKYINKSEYSEENKSNYKGSLLTRLESLTNGINSMIFSSDDIGDEALFDENVIVDLSRVGSTETKALIMGILILKLQEHRVAAAEGINEALQHVTVLEEAHTLLKRTSTEQSSETANLLGKSVEMLANSIAEMRTYGEGFIIADQSPGLLDMSVIRNTNTKIIMRLPDFSDRELVGKSAGLNEDQIIELAKLPRGVAAVYQNGWISPVLCKIEKIELKEEVFSQPSEYPIQHDSDLLLDLLDTKFRAKLDDLSEEESFKKAICKSMVPANTKVKMLKYLSQKNTREGIQILASVVFDCFKNAKETLECTMDEVSVEDLKRTIISTLEPSVMQYEEEQIDLLITLILHEYQNRFHVEYPVWREFTEQMGGGKIV